MAAADQLGIDVAGYQHPQGTSINWSAVKKDGVKFAFIKATESTNYTNPYFAGDWAATRSVGIYHGAYHFARPSVGSAAAQAKYFVSKAGLANKPGDLPPVLDLETNGGLGVRALRTWVTNWLNTVQNLTGRKPVIYTAPNFWSTSMGGSTAYGSYPLWIANYGVSSPHVPKGWSTWTFWQGNSTGKVPGISGSVDMDSFNGTLTQLAALANASGSASGAGSTTQPTPTAVATTVTLATSRASVYRGQSVKLSGSLATSTGTALASQRVVLRSRPQGQTSWTRVGSLATDSSGHFATTAKVMAATSYQIVFPGTAKYARSVSVVRSVAITPKTVTSLRLAADRTSVTKGSRVKLYGHLTTADGTPLAGRQVRYFVRPSGASTWTLVGSTTTTAPTGWLQLYGTPSKSSTYKAVYPGGLKYTRATSNWVTVTVP